MKRLTMYMKSVFAVAGLVALPLIAAPQAGAIDVFQGCKQQGAAAPVTGGTTGAAAPTTGTGTGGASSSSVCGAAGQDDFKKLMQNIINTMLVVLGMIAVIAIIIGGIRYTTSNGDPGQVKSAKDTIMYAVIGLIVAIMAYAIVGFVLSSFK